MLTTACNVQSVRSLLLLLSWAEEAPGSLSTTPLTPLLLLLILFFVVGLVPLVLEWSVLVVLSSFMLRLLLSQRDVLLVAS